MLKSVIPYNVAYQLAFLLKATAYPIPGVGYNLFITFPLETDEQAQYWYEIRPGKSWESRCNRFAQKAYLAVMDEQMEKIIPQLVPPIPFTPEEIEEDPNKPSQTHTNG